MAFVIVNGPGPRKPGGGDVVAIATGRPKAVPERQMTTRMVPDPGRLAVLFDAESSVMGDA